MIKKISILPFVIFLFILIIFFFLLTKNRDPSSLPSALISKKVPSFTTESVIKSEKFISDNEFTNEIILVNFFATWCKPCKDEHPYIKNLALNKKIKVIGINYKDDKNKTLKWLKELGNPYSSIAIDNDGRIAIDWGVYGIPETFIVDSKSIIQYRHVGPITKNAYKKISKIIDDTK
mgnify:CR=1 FL=1